MAAVVSQYCSSRKTPRKLSRYRCTQPDYYEEELGDLRSVREKRVQKELGLDAL